MQRGIACTQHEGRGACCDGIIGGCCVGDGAYEGDISGPLKTMGTGVNILAEFGGTHVVNAHVQRGNRRYFSGHVFWPRDHGAMIVCGVSQTDSGRILQWRCSVRLC